VKALNQTSISRIGVVAGFPVKAKLQELPGWDKLGCFYCKSLTGDVRGCLAGSAFSWPFFVASTTAQSQAPSDSRLKSVTENKTIRIRPMAPRRWRVVDGLSESSDWLRCRKLMRE
jgi:hypothetical protein